MCLTRKQARHLPDILCGLTRARDHRSARVAARKHASQNCEVATALRGRHLAARPPLRVTRLHRLPSAGLVVL